MFCKVTARPSINGLISFKKLLASAFFAAKAAEL